MLKLERLFREPSTTGRLGEIHATQLTLHNVDQIESTERYVTGPFDDLDEPLTVVTWINGKAVIVRGDQREIDNRIEHYKLGVREKTGY